MRTLVQNKYNENIGILKTIKQIAKTFFIGQNVCLENDCLALASLAQCICLKREENHTNMLLFCNYKIEMTCLCRMGGSLNMIYP